MKNQIHPGYETLLKEVLPLMGSWTEDILEYGKDLLTNYEGKFLSLRRECGEDTILLGHPRFGMGSGFEYINVSPDRTYESYEIMINRAVSLLLINSDGTYETIDKQKASELTSKLKEEAQAYIENIKKINLEGISFVLKEFISSNGRTWKSKLKTEWSENGTYPELRRLRNYFGCDFLSMINAESSQDEILKKLFEFYLAI